MVLGHPLTSLVCISATLAPIFQLVSADFSSRSFALRDSFVGWQFLGGFEWETIDDPTHGRVNYVDRDTALRRNLTYASDSKFVMQVDHENVVQPGSRGRDSNRIRSYNAYSDSVIVIDVQHMPEGCGTWPAFWTLSASGPWPNGGEIDIIEGVNNQAQNLATLHTTEGCTQPQYRDQQGSTVSTECNANVNYNQGCGTLFPTSLSYGTGFNNAGGGWFAMARTARDGIAVFFWSRGDPNVPRSVRYGSANLRVDNTWGQPHARFVTDSCDMNRHFDEHIMIFDTTFCGDWAGSMFSQMGCGSDCQGFVDQNPDAFVNAYWEINSLRIYS